MPELTVAIFFVVYLGMILGGLPFLQLDRTGVALLGAIALIGTDALTLQEAAEAIHLPTVILLFAFMVLSAQMRLGGFYDWVTLRLAKLSLAPPLLLGALILASAALSAVFSNDIVCLAVAPVLIDACRTRRLDPVPFLLALACAANIGSAATLIVVCFLFAPWPREVVALTGAGVLMMSRKLHSRHMLGLVDWE